MAGAESPAAAVTSSQTFQHISAKDQARIHNGNVYGNIYHGHTFHDSRSLEDRFLDSLCFPGMYGRHERPLEAFEGTYDWILNGRVEHICGRCEGLDERGLEEAVKPFGTDSWELRKCQTLKRRDCDLNAHSRNFLTWLKTPDNKDIYWVHGKPGSGKSTLMNHLLSGIPMHCSSQDKPSMVIAAGHFFWAAGGSLEKSINGLMRNLLYQILRRQRHLIAELSLQAQSAMDGNGVAGAHWGLRVLRQTLRKTLKEGAGKTEYVFLIDGLDEAVGDRQDLVDFIAELNSNAATKLCVASRDEAPFRATYDRLKDRCLCLQDLNDVDIDHYMHSRLDSHQIQSETPLSPYNIACVSKLVRQSAEGVFLWVRLAVDDIRRGIARGDNLLELQKRVERMPPELDAFIQRIFDSIDDMYRLCSSRLMLLCLSGPEGRVPLCWPRHMQEEHNDDNFALTAPFRQITYGELYQRQKEAVALVAKWTMGLMMCSVEPQGKQPLGSACDNYEIGDAWVTKHSFVTFCHRSVREFAGQSRHHEGLRATAGGEQRTHLTACRTLLKASKYLERGDSPTFLEIGAEFGKYARLLEAERLERSASQQDRRTEDSDILWPTLINLWKELDRVGKTLFPTVHWMLIRIGDSPATRFSRHLFRLPSICGLLAFTLDCDCIEAFSSMVRHAKQEEIHTCLNFWLLVAVSPVLDGVESYRERRRRFEADGTLVTKLLTLGADFNASITADETGHDYSVWQRTLLMLYLHICRYSMFHDWGKTDNLVRFVERLLWYGADPDAQVWAGDIRRSVYEDAAKWKHPMQSWIAVADIFGPLRQEQARAQNERQVVKILEVFQSIHACIIGASQAKTRNQQMDETTISKGRNESQVGRRSNNERREQKPSIRLLARLGIRSYRSYRDRYNASVRDDRPDRGANDTN